MKKEKNIVSYSAEELDQMLARGESKTDWERIHNMTDEEIERNADEDAESPPYPYPTDFWQDAELVSPKEKISIRLNKHVIDYFKGQGTGYQKRINAVLEEYVRQHMRHERHREQKF